MDPTEIPPWLRKILDESQDPDACMKAIRGVVLPEWQKAHPHHLLPARKKPGPRPFDPEAVRDTVLELLEGLGTQDWKTITWKEFVYRVQVALGNSPTKKDRTQHRPYHADLISRATRAIMASVWLTGGCPPKLSKTFTSSRRRKPPLMPEQGQPTILTFLDKGERVYLPGTEIYDSKTGRSERYGELLDKNRSSDKKTP